MKWLISAIVILFILLMLLAAEVIGLKKMVAEHTELAQAQSVLNEQFVGVLSDIVGGYEK